MKKLFAAMLFTALISGKANAGDFEYTVYLESWDSAYQSAYQELSIDPPSDFPDYNGVTVNISFAAFTFTPASSQGTNASGLYGTYLNQSYGSQDLAVANILSYVHGKGGKVQMAYGGNSYAAPYYPDYFISQTSGWPNNASTLATGVANVINALNLDGVDFDIEDPQPSSSTAIEFAAQLTTFLQEVRALLPTKNITLTIPAQGWGQYWQYLAQNVAAIPGLVDAINFMEYDIWVNPDVGYVGQVEADILTYTSPTTESPAPNWAQGWGIPASLVQLGIMPGNDDTGQTMTTDGAQSLTRYAMTKNLPGVFIWDIDRDAMTIQTPVPFYPSTPYAYSNAIRQTISEYVAPETTSLAYASRDRTKRFVIYTAPYEKQINPLQGKPPYE